MVGGCATTERAGEWRVEIVEAAPTASNGLPRAVRCQVTGLVFRLVEFSPNRSDSLDLDARGIYVSETEVAEWHWKKVMGSPAANGTGHKCCPVINQSPNDIFQFLSVSGHSLPTGAELAALESDQLDWEASSGVTGDTSAGYGLARWSVSDVQARPRGKHGLFGIASNVTEFGVSSASELRAGESEWGFGLGQVGFQGLQTHDRLWWDLAIRLVRRLPQRFRVVQPVSTERPIRR